MATGILPQRGQRKRKNIIQLKSPQPPVYIVFYSPLYGQKQVDFFYIPNSVNSGETLNLITVICYCRQQSKPGCSGSKAKRRITNNKTALVVINTISTDGKLTAIKRGAWLPAST